MSLTTARQLRFSMPAPSKEATTGERWPFFAAFLVILALSAVRILYLASSAAIELAPDEAHYWDWSRHLDWSYYSKGPLVAWLIRLSCSLTGADSMLAIRLPAVLCGALTLLGLFRLTNNTYRRPRLALLAVLLSLALPLFHVGALLMTIDAPYVAAWTWALLLAQTLLLPLPSGERAGVRGRPSQHLGAWTLLGLIIGLGILAKYTMILFIPSFALFCLLSKDHRVWFRRPGPYLMTLSAALCCLPIIIWNIQHGWVTLKHVGGQAGLAAGEFTNQTNRINWLGPLEYLAGQFALLLAFGFITYLAAITRTLKNWGQTSALRTPHSSLITHHSALSTQHSGLETQNESFLATLSLATFFTFLLFSFTTKVQLNWPIAAYLSALPLCVKWIADQWTELTGWKGKLFRAGTTLAMLAGLALSVVIHHTEWLYPIVAPLTKGISPRRWDPTCRIRGWSTPANEVQKLREQLRTEGVEPILCCTLWNMPGEIAFYLPDHPTVYCLGALAGDRQSQYDFWQPHPAHQPDAFAGKAFIIVGDLPPSLLKRFDAVAKTRTLTHEVHGQPVATWGIAVARGFKTP